MILVQDSLTLLANAIALLGFIYLAAGFILVTATSTPRQPGTPDPWSGDVESETEPALPLLPPAAEPEPETQTTALILDEIASIKLRPARLVCSQLGIPQKRHRKSRPLAVLREEILQHFLSNQQVVITALEAAKAG